MAALLTTNEQLTTLSEAPAQNAFAITPADGSDLPALVRAIWVGGAGDLRVILVGDSVAVTFTGIPAGTLMPLAVKRVLATSTTATALLGLQ